MSSSVRSDAYATTHAWSIGSSGSRPSARIHTCCAGGSGSRPRRSIGLPDTWRMSIGRSRSYQSPSVSLNGSMRSLNVASDSGSDTSGIGS